jgi:hypothetical protein
MRRVLRDAAVQRNTVTYGHLMGKFGLSRGSGRGKTVVGALTEIDREERAAGAPGFAALVVRKDSGYPGGGFFEGVRRKGATRRGAGGRRKGLTDAEMAYADKERERVWSYYRRRYAGPSG